MGHAHPCRHAQVHELTSKCRAAGANDEHSTAITWERISVADCRKQVGVQTRCAAMPNRRMVDAAQRSCRTFSPGHCPYNNARSS